MNNNFDILKNIDNDELYEKTYISINNLDDIKNKNFKAFTRFKFNGFIDILSKRLELDLNDFKDEANIYFDEIEPKIIIEDEVEQNNSLVIDKKMALLIGAGVIIVALIIAVITAHNSKNKDENFAPAEPVVEQQIAPIVPAEQISAIENNISDANDTVEQIVPQQTALQSTAQDIKIIPQKNIWVGIIDVTTKEKKEYSGKNEIVLDKTKKQIIVVDGAYISLMNGNEETKYAQDGRIRFMLEDGKIKEIRFAQFKELNNGKAW